MKKIKKTILFILIIIISSIFVQLFKVIKYQRLEKKEVYNLRIKIKNCIDINNKNKRKVNENIELIEYCINEFGSNN